MNTTVIEVTEVAEVPETDQFIPVKVNVKRTLQYQFNQFLRRKEIARQLHDASIKVIEGQEMIAFSMIADCMTKLS